MANITTAGTSDFPTSLDTRNTLTGGSTGSDILVEHYNGAAASIINLETVLGARKTQGSVLFAGVSGNYTESNAQLFWDNTNNRLGIGTATPLVALDVVSNFNIRGVGPHAVGGATNTAYQLLLTGAFTGITNAVGLEMTSTLTVPVNGGGFGVDIGGLTLNKAGSGTHADFASLQVQPPTIGAGAAVLTNATTLKITGAPSVGTNLRALWVTSGTSEFGAASVWTASGTSGAAGSNWIGPGSATRLQFNVPTGSSLVWSGNNVDRMILTDTGILAVGTTVTTGAGAGDTILANNKAYRILNAAGTSAVAAIVLDGGNNVVLGGTTLPVLGMNLAAVSLPIAGAGQNGTIGVDSTNNRFVFYVGGSRFFITGTAF